ncbi:OR8H3 protein, partial [Crocuta crocuta]
MTVNNFTEITLFILSGFAEHPELQVSLFLMFLFIYLFTVLGNLGLIMLIRIDSNLHTPMYFFLSNLAFIDIFYSSTVTPKALVNFQSKQKTISFVACFVQMYFFVGLVCSECFLLGSMAYDRYVAICNPLLYSVVMSRKVCNWLGIMPYAIGFTNSLISVCQLNTMGKKNNTHVPDFILMGLTDSEEIQLVLFILFLLIYLVTVLGNVGMILIICLDLQLHTPMYFFLSHLSFLDLSYSTVITPKTLYNLLTSTKYISYMSCFIQMYFFVFLGATECFLLSSMAYDRYVAICDPLHYPVVMSRRFCSSLIFGSYMIGFVDSSINVLCMSRLHFCDSNVIRHFFCDTPPVLALSCTDTHDIEIMIFIVAGSTLMVSLITISVSYVSILSTILKMTSTSGKRKAFSTCASHL